MQAKISDQQKQLTTLEADHKHLKEKHREKMCTLSQDQDELENVCGSRDFETVLADVTKQLDNAQVLLMVTMIHYKVSAPSFDLGSIKCMVYKICSWFYWFIEITNCDTIDF